MAEATDAERGSLEWLQRMMEDRMLVFRVAQRDYEQAQAAYEDALRKEPLEVQEDSHLRRYRYHTGLSNRSF